MQVLTTPEFSQPGPSPHPKERPSDMCTPCRHHTYQISQVRLLAPHEGPVFAHSCHPLVGSLVEILPHVIPEVVPGQGWRRSPSGDSKPWHRWGAWEGPGTCTALGAGEGNRVRYKTGTQNWTPRPALLPWGGGGNQEFGGLSLRWANAWGGEAPRCTHAYPPKHPRVYHHLRLSRLLMKYMAAAPTYLAMAPSTVPKLPSLTM